MIISEWLPNPVGSDTEGEWVELYNNGGAPVTLAGWRIENGAGKAAVLRGDIAPGEYLLLRRSATKLTLRNENEHLRLISPDGTIADESAWPGRAVEGKSVSRVGEEFILADPTPAAANAAVAPVMDSSPPPGLLAASFGWPEASVAALATGLVLSAAVFVLILKNHDLRKLFFGGN